jgi:hypothetical protein
MQDPRYDPDKQQGWAKQLPGMEPLPLPVVRGMAADEVRAAEALGRWHQQRPYRGLSEVQEDDPDDIFLAGFDAGVEVIRDAVLKLWDDNDAWIAGGNFRELAKALGVPPERTQTYRQAGESRPGPDSVHRNIDVG